MEFLVPIVALIMIFGPGFYAIKRVFDLKEKRLSGGANPAELEGLREERRLLQERVENLESIVCDVDFELNRRIAAIASEPALLAEAARPAAVAGAVTDEASENRTGIADAAAGDTGAGDAAATGATITSPGARPLARTRPAAIPGELTLGDTLAGRYRVDRLLGRGGMGAVYLAHDEVLGEEVALKVISSAWAVDEREMLDRLRREVSATRRIASPHVIRIHDLGEADGVLYISMEHVDGHTLADEIANRRTLDDSAGRKLLAGVCDGLSAAHDSGVVHRDLKPHNVLVRNGGGAVIIDFGLAKAAFMGRMTATGVLVGTPHYMSPEQVRGGEVDARSDIYSLGAVTYHAMTGRPPFDGPNPIAIGFAHCHDDPIPPHVLRPGLGRELSKAIMAALAKSPDDRPATAKVFKRALV